MTFLKWIVFSFVMGLISGVVGALFYHGLNIVTSFRNAYPQAIFLLPVGALAIALLYHILHNDADGGTNLVLAAIHADNEIPLRMAPLIMVSTWISHLCGASVGREGAALQVGGSIGNTVGRLFGFESAEKKTMIMCGMSGVFSALFGTPLAAAIFSMEVVSVGIMHYAALVPCVISSFVARDVAERLGVPAPRFDIMDMPQFSLKNAAIIALLAVLCAFVSVLFCVALHKGGAYFRRILPNVYIRAIVGGSTVLLLTLLVGNTTYNGAGIDFIELCMAGNTHPLSFLIKIVFTVLSICAGYRGGEIVPSFFIGASFGCLFGQIIGFAPSMCAAVGMGAVFCGVTNCPITALLICFELFGFAGSPFFMIAVALSFMVSGYYGLYQEQRIIYSKFNSNYINKQTK